MKSPFLLLFFISSSLSAQIQLAKIFSSNMVLQRDKPIHIWGKGRPGDTIIVKFLDEKTKTEVKKDSAWEIFFPAKGASSKANSILIEGETSRIELKNIVIGDIWLCLGQSNMEWPLEKEMHFAEVVALTIQPLIRFYNPSWAGKNVFSAPFSDSIIDRLNTGNFYKGSWEVSDSISVKTMSAVGFYFGKMIRDSMGVPIGLINLSIGGCPIETFIDKETLLNSQSFSSKVKGNWLKNEALPVWVRERGNQNLGNQPHVFSDESGPRHAYKPGFAYENGIKPILALPVKGIIWYQGESNAQEIDRVDEYGTLMKLMVDDYRKKWNLPHLPFYWVQLSSIDSVNYKSQLWPAFRNEQRNALKQIEDGGMAVCSDIGSKNNVHPTNKKDVGERLARWALNRAYGREIIPSGPLPLTARLSHDKIYISFLYPNGLTTADGGELKGFSIDVKTECKAMISKNSVIIEAKGRPEYVYYGWKPYTEANLVNGEGLPASTFKLKVE